MSLPHAQAGRGTARRRPPPVLRHQQRGAVARQLRGAQPAQQPLLHRRRHHRQQRHRAHGQHVGGRQPHTVVALEVPQLVSQHSLRGGRPQVQGGRSTASTAQPVHPVAAAACTSRSGGSQAPLPVQGWRERRRARHSRSGSPGAWRGGRCSALAAPLRSAHLHLCRRQQLQQGGVHDDEGLAPRDGQGVGVRHRVLQRGRGWGRLWRPRPQVGLWA